jgi:protein ImuB
LLGKERVGTPVLEDSHRADAFHLEPFSWKMAKLPDDSAEESVIGPALRRLRRSRSPASVAVAPVCDRRGPYRSSGDWWDEKRWARTEWDFELENGVVCRCREEPEKSILEGIYD